MKRGIITYLEKEDETEINPDEMLSEAHFQTLKAVFSWWQIMPLYNSESQQQEGYKISVYNNGKRGEAGGFTMVQCINNGLKLAEKLE